MKRTSLKAQPPHKAIAKRNGGNGGYSRKTMQSAADKKPMVRRALPLYDAHGNKVRA